MKFFGITELLSYLHKHVQANGNIRHLLPPELPSPYAAVTELHPFDNDK